MLGSVIPLTSKVRAGSARPSSVGAAILDQSALAPRPGGRGGAPVSAPGCSSECPVGRSIPLPSLSVHVMFRRFTGRAPTSMIRFGHHRRYSPERNWEPLSNDEWAVLSPFLYRAAEAEMETRREAAIEAAQHPDAPPFRDRRPAGRPVRDPRTRLDAIFWLAAHTLPGRAPPPWAALPPEFGKPDTISRQFRRWAKQGLWTKLLHALADSSRPGIRSSAAWKAGSAAPIAAPGACSAWKAWRWPGASASFLRCAAPPGCCPTPICPNRSFPSSAPPCSAPASTACAPSRTASCAATRSCWPSPPAEDPSREPWRRHDRLPPCHSRPRRADPRPRRAYGAHRGPASRRSRAVQGATSRRTPRRARRWRAFVRSGRPPAPASLHGVRLARCFGARLCAGATPSATPAAGVVRPAVSRASYGSTSPPPRWSP